MSATVGLTRETRYPDSLYAETALYQLDFDQIESDLDCDVCVIGGGYTGLSAALHLAEQGRDVILAEARAVGWGASGRNGGQLGSAHVVSQPDLVRQYGADHARALWDVSEDAKALTLSLIEQHVIDCGFVPGNLGLSVTKRDLQGWVAHAQFVEQQYGYSRYRVLSQDEVQELVGSEAYVGGICDPTAGHLHPLNLALGLAQAASARGVRIFENSRVRSIHDAGDSHRLITRRGSVRSGQVVLACNGYLEKLAPSIAGRVLPAENFQLTTAPLPKHLASGILTDNSCAWDTHFQVYYYRMTDDRRLIFGGGVGPAGSNPQGLTQKVRAHMQRVFPQLTGVDIDYVWGGTFANTRSQLPDMGVLGKGICYSQGYNGHGVALAIWSGRAIARYLSGDHRDLDLFTEIQPKKYPGGVVLRGPTLRAGIAAYRLADWWRR